jgi:proteasome-associated ATPase
MLVHNAGEEPLDGPSFQHLQHLRGQSPEVNREIDMMLLDRMRHLHRGMAEIQARQDELRAVIEKLGAPPYHPAIYLGTMETARGTVAVVHHGNAHRFVSVSDSCDISSLSRGDGVLLTNELNCLLERAPDPSLACGETAVFDRFVSADRAVLRSRDEETVACLSGPLSEIGLRTGDIVRWDRGAGLAFERIPSSNESSFFLEHTPQETFADIGGLDDRIEKICTVIRLQMEHPDLSRKYRLPPKRSILLVGPPGTGKTMLARALANWVATLAPSGRSRFMSIKPGEMNSMWYGQSEAIIRQTFHAAREAGVTDPDVPVVLFFDEVDSIGAARGGALGHIDDKVLEAFMVELEGLQDRGNVLVVAATNRRDLLDSALVRPGRLGDLEIRVPRPGVEEAREILRKYLRSDMPYAANGNGGDPDLERAAIVDATVSRIFAQNGESDVATVVFRDGKQRTVQMKDIVSGAVIKKLARDASEAACVREGSTGEPGIRLEDMLTTLAAEMEMAALSLTPANCRSQLENLPQDVDIVRVDPVRRRVAGPHRYIRLQGV